MPTQEAATLGMDEVIETTVRELVSARRVAHEAFISLPLLYPSGTSVTVKVTPTPDGYRVSDGGFAYREIEAIGATRSFAGTVTQIAEANDLRRNSRTVFTEADAGSLFRAVCDVGAASWQITDRVYSRLSEDTEEEVEEYVRARLTQIFGAPSVQSAKLTGASTSEWDVTAIVKQGGKSTVFQAVLPYANSIYRTNSAFDDLAALDDPPGLVAVVRNKAALGSRLALLSRTGRVIEDQQPDAVYLRAAA
jgi:hypothetical protein